MSPNPPSSLAERCDAQIARHLLLNHPFYVAWSAGTLPVDALRDYAGDYGAFIRTIGEGWSAVGEPAIARIEEGHARVWAETFAAPLGARVAEAPEGAVGALVSTARTLFAERTSALGALYAFEAQQPATARSKREGLATHYADLPAGLGRYFQMHEDDEEEPALLARALDALAPGEAAAAEAACARMSRALYEALTAIHAPYCAAEPALAD